MNGTDNFPTVLKSRFCMHLIHSRQSQDVTCSELSCFFVKLIEKMPTWSPALRNGTPQGGWVLLEVAFRLQ
jgi:hypothetical protein